MVRFKLVQCLIAAFALPLAGQALALHGRDTGHQGIRHRHHEHHARVPSGADTTVVPGPTVVVYQFDGQSLPLSEVCDGIKNGTFVWAKGTEDVPDCQSYGLTLTTSTTAVAPAPATASAVFTQTSSVVNSPTVDAHALVQVPTTTQVTATTSSAETTLAANTASADSAVYANTAGLTGYDLKIASNPNVSKPFPDGQIDCDTFPSAYGAVPIDWVGLGGWSGIQYTTISNNVVTNINTAISGNTCKNPGDGSIAFCSYACPAGYQKSQWPSTQGSASMAVSVGGLQCGTDSKLHLSNPSLSKYLCIPGTGQVNVQNKLTASNAICRTDYPGTEDETVAMVVQKSASSPLTCPDASKYYQHLNMATTAEYYVNMKGIAVDQACTWSSDGSNRGNWAPAVFGVGMDEGGHTWLSIQSTIQNNPSNYKDLDFTVELQGDFGGSKCFYTNGHYCTSGSPDSYESGSCQTIQTAKVPGCTVELMSGNATYVLTD